MTWVKICGITNLEDALTAVDAGAEAVGFVFHQESPRRVDAETAQQIVEKLPPKVEKVGVFVDLETERIREIASRVGLTGIQLHGNHSFEEFTNLHQTMSGAKVIAMVPGDTLKSAASFFTDEARKSIFAILLDSQSNGLSGGTGTSFDWGAARELVEMINVSIPVIVAGGLNPLNVAQAIKILKPFGVDVASGVEARPGKKDPGKLRAFISAAHLTHNGQ